jgi:undecaprenyl-diphosphatase
MTTLQAILIAIIEGLTEFLPISSTAHMKFLNPLIGVNNNSFSEMFEIVIQLAAILSVVVFFWKKFFDFKKISFYFKLIIAVIPALVFGALLKKHIDSAMDNLTIIACVMIGGGIILLFVDKWFTKVEIDDVDHISNKTALTIGGFQVLSILFPGLSRSAATIIGGLSQKLSMKVAAEFSFFLAVPTMFAASVKSVYDVTKEGSVSFDSNNLMILGIGSLVSFVVALLSIKFFIGFVKTKGFKVFGYYRIALGITVLILIATGVITQ